MQQFFQHKPLYIAIDFDGTCVTHEYPDIGKDIGAVPILKELVEQGHHLLINTMRSGKELTDVVKWCADNGIAFEGFNQNPTQSSWTSSPKVYAQIYIDDAALGCPLKWDTFLSKRPFVDWEKVKEMLKDRGVLQ